MRLKSIGVRLEVGPGFQDFVPARGFGSPILQVPAPIHAVPRLMAEVADRGRESASSDSENTDFRLRFRDLGLRCRSQGSVDYGHDAREDPLCSTQIRCCRTCYCKLRSVLLMDILLNVSHHLLRRHVSVVPLTEFRYGVDKGSRRFAVGLLPRLNLLTEFTWSPPEFHSES